MSDLDDTNPIADKYDVKPLCPIWKEVALLKGIEPGADNLYDQSACPPGSPEEQAMEELSENAVDDVSISPMPTPVFK